MMPEIKVFKDTAALADYVANQMAELIKRKPNATLTLPTGSTIMAIYRQFVELYRKGLVGPTNNVISFNLDAYVYPLRVPLPQDYPEVMHEALLQHVPFLRSYFPDGKLPWSLEEMNELSPEAHQLLDAACQHYHNLCSSFGSDLAIVPPGTNGHFAFHEPGPEWHPETYVQELAPATRAAHAIHYGGDEEKVPRWSITMGTSEAVFIPERVILIANDMSKVAPLAAAFTGEVTPACPFSLYQERDNVQLCITEDIAAALPSSMFAA